MQRALTAGNHTATLTESIVPVGKDALAWTLTMNGTSARMWSPSISAVLEAAPAAKAGRKLWLPWSRARCAATPAAGCNESETVCNGYASPLEPVSVGCLTEKVVAYGYGTGGGIGGTYGYGTGQGVSIPLAAMLDTLSDTAFTFSVAPAANLLAVTKMQMLTSASSVGVAFGPGYRVSSSSMGLSLTLHITSSHACPRDVLSRYSSRHAEYFVPPNRNVHYRASGMGSYAATQGPLDQMVDGSPLM